MSWQDDAMIEQEQADALNYMGEAEWRDTFKERSDYNSNYWTKHKDEIAQKRKEYYVKNKERIIARNKEWMKNNKDKWNAYQRKYRARIKLDKQKKA